MTTEIVPMSFPYASGHGSFAPSSLNLQLPDAYSFAKYACAIGTTAKASPTTHIMPVPSQRPVLKILNRTIWKNEKIPERISEVDTRYASVSASRFAPAAPAMRSGGVTTTVVISLCTIEIRG